MRLPPKAQNYIALCPVRIGLFGVENCAVSNASGKFSLILGSEPQLLTNLGAYAIGSNKEIGAITRLGLAAGQSY